MTTDNKGQTAMTTYREYLDTIANGQHPIKAALADWAKEYDHDGLTSVIQALETCDCAAVFAPPGLVYNTDLAEKAREWWVEIDEALDEYHDATGEHWHPGLMRSGGSFLSYVWFAVEWFAHDMASDLQNRADNDKFSEADANDEEADE